jgi:4-amino-4-deoxy-L-arabinose transferase-like glycosyltransferase
VRPAVRPRWSIPARVGVFTLAAVLYTLGLGRNGMGNAFYAAAVKSGTESWKAFFFGSIDPGNFITVDKPPAALWVQELSARVFGFSSWSILVPEALAGVVSVMVLYRLVRRWKGEVAAVLAALTLAVTPVATLMFRFNNPDAVLTLCLVLAAWALWAALESARTSRLVLCGALLGFAFLTKTLEALIVLPAVALVYLWAGTPRLRRRVVQLLWAGLALLVAGGWWVAAVELWPAASRPYLGGSTDNSELNLIFGYNGFSRVTGSGGPGGPNFAGAAGLGRMFNDLLGGQISWLLPLALVALLGGLVLTRAAPRTDRRRAGYLLWGGWLVMFLAVFSEAKGIFHPYYTVVMAPAIAALCGGCAVELWAAGRRSRRWAAVLPLCVIGSGIWAAVLLGRTPGYAAGLAPAIVVVGTAAGAFLALVLFGVVRARWAAALALGVAGLATLAGPTAYSISTAGTAAGGSVVSAGPTTAAASGPGPSPFSSPTPGARGSLGAGAGSRASGPFPSGPSSSGVRPPGSGSGAPPGSGAGGAGGPGDGASAGLIRYLEAHQGSARYLVAVRGSQAAAPIIIETGRAVIAMGGFSGSDPAPTLAQFARLVASGQVRYVLVQGAGVGTGKSGGTSPAAVGGGGAPGGPSGATDAVERWVVAHGKKVPASAYGGSAGGTLYLVTASSAR